MTVKEIKVPRLAESVSDAVLVEWLKPDGAPVRMDEPIATLETDKAAVEIAAEDSGILRHARKVQDKVHVGDVIARIEGNGAAPVTTKAAAAQKAEAPKAAAPAQAPSAPRAAAPAPSAAKQQAAAPKQQPAPPRQQASAPATPSAESAPFGPAVRRLTEEHGLDPSTIAATGKGGRVLKEDVLRAIEQQGSAAAPAQETSSAPRTAEPASAEPAPQAAGDRIVPMSAIRRRIAERLVRAQHEAAILTTFNEVDMTAVMDLRAQYKEGFEKKHGVRLGFMSFFAHACVLALGEIPEINGEIRGDNLVYHPHVHLGIAVQTDRGLVVPVVRDAHRMSFAQIEREIARLADKAREQRLTLQELSGGTFTISNGGVFGSLFSTPILNPPQSGILGMHKIEKRPIVRDDQVVVRPMMYVALSYDHRIVDGEQAVTFLVRVKERIEDPERMLLDV